MTGPVIATVLCLETWSPILNLTRGETLARELATQVSTVPRVGKQIYFIVLQAYTFTHVLADTVISFYK